jgi:hypothetical protein
MGHWRVEDTRQHIQLGTVELDAATHMQRQITLDQMWLQTLAVCPLKIRGDELSRRQRADETDQGVPARVPASW